MIPNRTWGFTVDGGEDATFTSFRIGDQHLNLMARPATRTSGGDGSSSMCPMWMRCTNVSAPRDYRC